MAARRSNLVGTQTPDLVLSDWNMPEMTGLDLLRHFAAVGRASLLLRQPPKGRRRCAKLADKAGAMALIVKPFTPDVFEDVLSTVVTS